MNRCPIAKVFVLLMAALSFGITGCSSDQLGMASNITSTALNGGGQIATGVLDTVAGYTGSPGVSMARDIVGTAVGGTNQIATGVLGNIAAGQQFSRSMPLAATNSGILSTAGTNYTPGSNLGGGNVRL
jgi:hypothetical protein